MASYSRPGNKGVNITPGRSNRSVPQIQLPSGGSTVTANGPLRDNRSPQTLINNGNQKAAQIETFLGFFNNTVAPFAVEQYDRVAKQQAGEVLNAYPSADITSSGTPEAIDAYNSLSGRAQSFVTEARAARAVAQYPAALQAEYAKRPVIAAAGDTPEQQEARALARSEAQQAARDLVGLTALPPYQTAVNGNSLAKAEGAIDGEAYKKRIARESFLTQNELSSTTANLLVDGFRTLSSAGADDQAGDVPLTGGLLAVRQEIADTIGLNYGPQDQAKILTAGIYKALNEISDPIEKLEFIRRLNDSTEMPWLGIDKKTNLWDIPLDTSGTTLKMALEGMADDAEVAADKEKLQSDNPASVAGEDACGGECNSVWQR